LPHLDLICELASTEYYKRERCDTILLESTRGIMCKRGIIFT
jgi:hypothetical protein